MKLPPFSHDTVEPHATYLALANGHYDLVTRFALVEVSRRGVGGEVSATYPPAPKQARGSNGSGALVLSGLAVTLLLLGGLLVNRLV